MTLRSVAVGTAVRAHRKRERAVGSTILVGHPSDGALLSEGAFAVDLLRIRGQSSGPQAGKSCSNSPET